MNPGESSVDKHTESVLVPFVWHIWCCRSDGGEATAEAASNGTNGTNGKSEARKTNMEFEIISVVSWEGTEICIDLPWYVLIPR